MISINACAVSVLIMVAYEFRIKKVAVKIYKSSNCQLSLGTGHYSSQGGGGGGGGGGLQNVNME